MKNVADPEQAPVGARGGRPRNRRIEVWLTPNEEAKLAERANVTGHSRSAYLRNVGLNHPIRSVVDLKAVADLAKVNGDLGRVAGLLKLWLAEKRGQGARSIEVETMMQDFRKLQEQVHQIMGQIVREK
ncbi:plasmid mobilization protein [Ochrobactrum sp. RH2CCR150]|uniref:plasmid mobilization protein n=1 Tax=Ochrobactrum sp. RH2CCR150 TaxID=2587044 RepID=UPI0015F94EFE|nr:hypothetical protein [Ochrobactrum sp. RH2CCR150]